MLKTTIVAVLAVLLFSAGTAIGGTESAEWSRTNNGVLCKSAKGGVICLLTTGKGYGVGLHRNFVFVMDLDTNTRVFTRLQP